MHPPDTRWVQRFTNFERAFLLLQDALAIKVPSIVKRVGITTPTCNEKRRSPSKPAS